MSDDRPPVPPRPPTPPPQPPEDNGDRTVIAPMSNIPPAEGQGGAPPHPTGPDYPPAATPPQPQPQAPYEQAPVQGYDPAAMYGHPPHSAPEDATIVSPGAVSSASPPPPDASYEHDQTVTAAGAAAPLPPPPPAPGQAQPFVHQEPIRALSPGTVINNMYRVEEPLDQGGMGRVFKGSEIGTGEAVAIKVILPEMAEDEKVAQMFRREARTLRRLHHDAIVRYFAYVPPDEHLNLHALVMGFIEGTKLSDTIRGVGALSTEDACDLFRRLADGLRKAHEIGVVHRDLSPDNVMLPNNDIRQAVLIDFGIARSSKVRDVTIGNEFAGKLKYVSPEQLGAYGGEADARSDIYSMGLLMIVALTGQASDMGDSIVEAVQKRQMVPDLSNCPAQFQSLLYQMLQPDPAHRPPTMNDVILELDAISGGAQPTTTYRTQMPLAPEPTMAPAPDQQVPGLQAAPTITRGFDQKTGMSPPPIPAQESLAEEEVSGSSGWLMLLLAVVVLGAGGIGGALYWSSTGGGTDLSRDDEDDGDAPLVQRIEGGQATFLAEETPEGCAYATLRSAGPNSGLIEGISTPGVAFDGLAPAFGQEFGSNPSLVTNSVNPPHCSSLALARTFQGSQAPGTEMILEKSTVRRAENVFGAIKGSNGRVDWLAIVAPDGRVFSLVSKLMDPIGDERRFSFNLPSAQPGIYLLVAITSSKALARTGAIRDGRTSDEVMPLIGSELAKDPQGTVALGVLEIQG